MGVGKGVRSDTGGALPGLVVLKEVSFRWASGKEDDEHAKIFRHLVEAKEKKSKKKVRGSKR